jgi:hypothetical protein
VSYESRTRRGLQRLFEEVHWRQRELDVEADRWIIFSDHHRGQRDGADDFQRCEAAYNAALGYYLESGHRLVLLGDVEELWENRPGSVLQAYSHTLDLEAQFLEDGRYDRYWGNHDDEWESSGSVKRHFEDLYPGLEAREGDAFRVTTLGDELGTLFLAHGHQGSHLSDRYRRLSRFVIRHTWRPVQRLARFPSTTPAQSFALRNRQDRAIYAWADSQPKLAVIAGHTQRPVFMGSSHQVRVEEELERLLAEAKRDIDSPAALLRVAELRAELEWIRVQGEDPPGKSGPTDGPAKPCYFNTGCCSFGDGSITGIEISDGLIKLVRWPDERGDPRPRVLASADIRREVFGAL